MEAKEILILLRNDLDDENQQNGDNYKVIWKEEGARKPQGRQFTFSGCDSPPTSPPAAAAAGPLLLSTGLAKCAQAVQCVRLLPRLDLSYFFVSLHYCTYQFCVLHAAHVPCNCCTHLHKAANMDYNLTCGNN